VETLPTPTGDIWGEDDNPRRYDAYAREYSADRETSRDLIALALPLADAGVADAAVLDLACGTGATTREILAVLGPHGRVTGVDKSAAMLRMAASSTTDTRAIWIQARAESVDQHVTEPVDALICNSAIWQTDFAATAMAVRAVMKAGGRSHLTCRSASSAMVMVTSRVNGIRRCWAKCGPSPGATMAGRQMTERQVGSGSG
jgi:ubiquinone/menaquinone biosynthesis C-methylase UbiE